MFGRNRRKSTAELIGIKEIREHSIISSNGDETVYYKIKPSNLSVLSEDTIRQRIYGLVTVLKGITSVGMYCTNSRENFDDNKRFLKRRLEDETSPVIRSLLQKDLKELDRMQVQMATSREFLITVRPDKKNDRDRANLLNSVEKRMTEQGFQARLAERDEIKSFLAVYFEQNFTTDKFEDFDGERWILGE